MGFYTGSLIYRLKGVDPDGDDLTFGVREQPDNDVISIEKFGRNEANVYLRKPLDREVCDASYFFLLYVYLRLHTIFGILCFHYGKTVCFTMEIALAISIEFISRGGT